MRNLSNDPSSLGSASASFIGSRHALAVNGRSRQAESGKDLPVFDPSSGEEIARVPDAGIKDVDRAVKAAREAFDSGPWPTLKPAGRERLKIYSQPTNRAIACCATSTLLVVACVMIRASTMLR